MKRRPGRRLSVGSIGLQVQGQEKKPERGFELTGRGGKRHSVCRRLNGAAAAFSRCLPAATPERRDGEGREEANQISSINDAHAIFGIFASLISSNHSVLFDR